MNSKIYYSLRKPGYQRKRFSIVEKGLDGKWRTLNNEVIANLNTDFLNGRISIYEAEKRCREVLLEFYSERDRQGKLDLSSENERIMQEYFAWKYLQKHRKARISQGSIESGYYDLKRAITAIGSLSLKNSPVHQLQQALDDYYDDRVGPHKKSTLRINALLRFLERPKTDKVDPLPAVFGEVEFLICEEFYSILDHIYCNRTKAVMTIAYFTGLRLGEIFGLQKKHVRNTGRGFYIFVQRQMLKDLTYTLPKRRKVRQAFGFKEVSDALALWLEVSEVDRIKLRKRKFSAWVRKACSDSKMDKSICFHDLRHCYAINLLNRGISMSRVAMCLGNDEGVCKRHYTGYSISQEGLDILAETVSKHDF